MPERGGTVDVFCIPNFMESLSYAHNQETNVNSKVTKRLSLVRWMF